jgi:cell division protein FtsB
MRLVIAFGTCILLIGLFGGDHGLPAMLQARRDAAMLTTRIAALRAENAALRRRAEALRNDPSAIEMEARASLGLARPGEIVVARSR